MVGETVEEALDVAVDEADYGYAEGWVGLGGGVVWGEGGGEIREEEEFGEAHSVGQCNARSCEETSGFARYPTFAMRPQRMGHPLIAAPAM